ncbi:ATP-binding protein [Dyadobacter sp.]|uniref:ATP-binding protein n=1 Tax=Dyadobacter sp. TaxID=1914288 RepID=UPI003F707CAC
MSELLNVLEKKYPNHWNQQDDINGIRTRTLEFLLIAYSVLGVCLSVMHYFEHKILLLEVVMFFVSLSMLAVGMLRKGIPMQNVAHFALVSLSFAIISTSLLFEPGNHLISLQYIFVLLSASFYLLGARWGLIYSVTNVVITCGIMVGQAYQVIPFFDHPFSVQPTVLFFGVIYNCAMLLYIHFRYFKDSELSNAKEMFLLGELKNAAADAHDMADYKSNFLLMISHEIRTPLHAIVGGIDIFMNENPQARQDHALESVKLSAAVLDSVVDDVLNLNELEVSKITLRKEQFKPLSIVTDICQVLRAHADRKHLSLTTTSSPGLSDLSVIGDPVRLSQILMNLTSNSIRYTEAGSIEIDIRAKQSSDTMVDITFRVSDTGIGIPEEFKADIFEPFKIIRSASRKQYHGTGFGLPLVKKLVGLLGGTIEFDSVEGSGTSFYFTITYPVPDIVSSRGTNSVGKPEPLKLNVLIAEDDKMNVLVLAHSLKKWNLDFDVAENGLLALELMKSKEYDVVLMDINMPVMDGVEASRHIRALDSPKSKVPIIALTAANKKMFEFSDDLALFDDWMSKPFQPQLLYARLLQVAKSS